MHHCARIRKRRTSRFLKGEHLRKPARFRPSSVNGGFFESAVILHYNGEFGLDFYTACDDLSVVDISLFADGVLLR